LAGSAKHFFNCSLVYYWDCGSVMAHADIYANQIALSYLHLDLLVSALFWVGS
jgi:hypothetical protein